MTNVFKRIADSISADIHQLIDQKERKNPLTALNQYLRESEKEKEKVSKLIERQYRLKDEFTREYLKANELREKRFKQAQLAELAGETELHEFALKEFEEYDNRAKRMEASRDEASEQLRRLEEKFEEMKHKLKDMHLRRMELMGRENIAKANFEINKVIDETSTKPFSKFSEIESYIEGIEQRINHAYEKSTFDYKMAKLEREFAEKKEKASE